MPFASNAHRRLRRHFHARNRQRCPILLITYLLRQGLHRDDHGHGPRREDCAGAAGEDQHALRADVSGIQELYSKDKFDHCRAPRSEFIRTELAKVFDIAFADPEDATVDDKKWNLSGFPTAHSLRASAVLWALRCHCPEYRAKRCGRWLGGGDANWSRYAQNGSAERKTYLETRQMDPVFSLWRFTDNICNDVLDFQR